MAAKERHGENTFSVVIVHSQENEREEKTQISC